MLALESVDLPGNANVAQAILDPSGGLRLTEHGAAVSIRLEAATETDWPYGASVDPARRSSDEIELVPYFSWANRGPSTMRVWIPTMLK